MNERQDPIRLKIKILFEFTVPKPKLTFFRAVSTINGGFRIEKRGEHAKKFKPTMWCGSEDGLLNFRIAVETYYQNLPRSKK